MLLLSNTNFYILKIIKLNAIDSTNSFLKNANRENILEDETFVRAKTQTNGRGQMGTNWNAVEGKSLTFSLLKRFRALPLDSQASLSFAVALSIRDALEALQIPKLSIKWPNDIMSYNKKVCGILIENQTEGNKISVSIIGIGININETEFKDLPQASSLLLSSGNFQNIEEVFEKVADSLLKELVNVENGLFPILKKRYESYLFRKNKISVFEDEKGMRFNGIIKGVTDFGALQIEDENQKISVFQLKQVKLLF